MRKIITIFMTLLMCMNLAFGAHAAEGVLSIPEVPVSEGQTIYVAVTLTESVIGDSVGITYGYDKAVLEAIYSSATWGKEGMLQDFSREDSGVWASGKAMDLKGTVCILAFRVKSGVTLTETAVSCTVTVKNDAETVGTYQAQGKIYAVCDHGYTKWESSGNLSHSRVCEKCGDKQTQTHMWGEGIISDHPENSHVDLITYTCEVCGAERTEEIANQGEHTQPPVGTEPPTEAPTEPEYVTRPPETTPPATRPTYPRPGEATQPLPTEPQKPTEGQETEHSETQEPTAGQNSNANQNAGGTLTDYNDKGSAGNKNSETTHSPSESQNDPTAPVEGTETEESQPTVNPYHNQGADPMAPTNHPIAVPVPATEEPHDHDEHQTTLPTEPVHDHTHDGEQTAHETGVSVMALGVAAMLVAVAIGLTVILLKRIKHK